MSPLSGINAYNPGLMPRLTAEWQGLKMSAGDVTRLKPGDLLSLDPACAAQVLVRLGNIPKFFGRPGTSDAKWAVQLTAAITK